LCCVVLCCVVLCCVCLGCVWGASHIGGATHIGGASRRRVRGLMCPTARPILNCSLRCRHGACVSVCGTRAYQQPCCSLYQTVPSQLIVLAPPNIHTRILTLAAPTGMTMVMGRMWPAPPWALCTAWPSRLPSMASRCWTPPAQAPTPTSSRAWDGGWCSGGGGGGVLEGGVCAVQIKGHSYVPNTARE
jgi:hypothetical protein